MNKQPLVGVIDYGSGNILSVVNALKAAGAEVYVGRETSELKKCGRYVLPGVGAYADCMRKIKSHGLDVFISDLAKSGKPLLGICVGMQILGATGAEFGLHKGLGLLKGNVESIREMGLETNARLPIIGWRDVDVCETEFSWLFNNAENNRLFYFFHSFAFPAQLSVKIAQSKYGNLSYTAAIASENIIGLQFHPEKSRSAGIQLLSNFIKWSV